MLETRVASRDAVSTAHKPAAALSDPFVFVPITQQEAAKGRGAAKRIVRAHVTRVQHAKSSTLSSTQDLQTWTVKPYVHRETVASIRRKTKPKVKRVTSESSGKDSNSSDSSTDQKPALIPVGHAGQDPFWSYPVEYQPCLAPIFAHYVQNIAVDIPDLDGPNDRGVIRRKWFPLAMTDAATMYAVLLMSASHYCILNPSMASLIDLLHLKARALSEINAALANPNKAVTDSIIGAVMKMAAYEAIFGDSEMFRGHMKGLKMMIKLRGGFSELGLNGLLERMIVWIDLNAAHITGLPSMIDGGELLTEVSFDGPNPYHFAGIS